MRDFHGIVGRVLDFATEAQSSRGAFMSMATLGAMPTADRRIRRRVRISDGLGPLLGTDNVEDREAMIAGPSGNGRADICEADGALVAIGDQFSDDFRSELGLTFGGQLDVELALGSRGFMDLGKISIGAARIALGRRHIFSRTGQRFTFLRLGGRHRA